MTIKFLDQIFKDLFGNNLNYLIIASKTIAAFIVLFFLISKLAKTFSKNGEVFTNKEGGFTPTDLLKPLIIVVLIISSTNILSLFDTFLVYIENAAFEGIDIFARVPNKIEFENNLSEANTNLEGKTLQKIIDIATMLNPINWVGGKFATDLLSLSSIFDALIYPFFLAKRYFTLGLVKLFFPLMIAMSTFDKTKDYAINIMKIYARAYLTIIPMVFCVIFCEHIFNNIILILKEQPGLTGDVVVAISGGLIQNIAVLFIIFIKIALFKLSFQLMDKFIP